LVSVEVLEPEPATELSGCDPDIPWDIFWLMQSCTRPQIHALKSSQPLAGTAVSVLLPEAWQSPLVVDCEGDGHDDDEAGTRADPVFGNAAGAAVLAGAAGGAGLIVGTLAPDPCALPGAVTVLPLPGEDAPAAGSCW
jgi:hypothetical protein